MDETRSTVSISRTMSTDVGMRDVFVSIDEGPRGRLAFGQSTSAEIAPGEHVLHAYNTLVWKHVKFETKPGERVSFLVANRSGKFAFSFLALMGVGPLYLTVERVPDATSPAA